VATEEKGRDRGSEDIRSEEGKKSTTGELRKVASNRNFSWKKE